MTRPACEYCGQPLSPMYVTLLGRQRLVGYRDCQCDQAVAARQRAAALRQQAEAEAIQNRWIERDKAAGIPALFAGAQHPQAAELAEALEAGHPLYLWGPIGTRKTTCLCAVARRLVRDNKGVKVTSVRAILGEIERSFREGGNPIEAYSHVPFLLLDDIGKEQPTAFVLSKLFDLIDTRYANALTTSVTSQYKPSGLVNRLALNGDFDTARAIVSRLRQNAVVREFDGPDMRTAGDAR